LPITVLVVDDEPAVLSFVTVALTRKGYRVIVATDGEEGFAAYLQHRERISVTLLDLSMPKLGGTRLGQQILEISPDAKLIFMTGFSPTFTLPRQFDGYTCLRKPFTSMQMIDAIHTVVADRSITSDESR
jgi:DNA-binding NtrC family response regulator